MADLIGSLSSSVRGRAFFSSAPFHCRVLQLMNLTDSRLPQSGCEKLELSFLTFFEQFRKIYIGEQVSSLAVKHSKTIEYILSPFVHGSQIPKPSKVYKRLQDVLGISEEYLVLSVFMRKM